MKKDLALPQHQWIYPQLDPAWEKKIVEEFHIHPITAKILSVRGFKDLESIHRFLYAALPDLHEPELFSEMDKALKRILQALQNQEKILIYGDNDVDGMTGTVLLTEFFSLLNAKVTYYISNRTPLQQTLIHDALCYAQSQKCSLLITVDCGVSFLSEMQEALKKNIDIIVTDHHEPTEQLPHCVATLNPKLVNNPYPNRDLTGVGVAFKLAHALTNALFQKGIIDSHTIDLKNFLDLVAMGTIADMGSVKGENRILVRYGLRQIRKNQRLGLAKLCQLCGVNVAEITTSDIASKVAPRFNSLGRIADPNKGVKLLLMQDATSAENLAKELELNNVERQKIERKDVEDVENFLHRYPMILKEKAIVLHSNKWHPGIIPILTTRIAKQYHRPTLVIAVEDGLGKGSLRTISSFPLLEILKNNAHLLINFGGHDYAAGLTIKSENIPLFRQAFIEAANQKLLSSDIQSKLQLDAQLQFHDLNFDLMESLCLLEPFGIDNPPPIFYTTAKQIWPPKIVGNNHLKLYLNQQEIGIEAIGFGMGHFQPALLHKNMNLTIAFTPQINHFLQRNNWQIQLRDMHF